MKTIEKNWIAFAAIFCSGLIIIGTALTARSQTAPVLAITPLGTNQFFISFTNNGSTYDLQGTPVLANPAYPWTWAATGIPGQSNFVVTGIYPTEFYRTILDTNAIPLWEAADPNNPALGALTITIDTPANGSTLQ